MKYQRSIIVFKKGTYYKMTISELETIAFAIIKKSLTICLNQINISRDTFLYLKKEEYFVYIN